MQEFISDFVPSDVALSDGWKANDGDMPRVCTGKMKVYGKEVFNFKTFN